MLCNRRAPHRPPQYQCPDEAHTQLIYAARCARCYDIGHFVCSMNITLEQTTAGNQDASVTVLTVRFYRHRDRTLRLSFLSILLALPLSSAAYAQAGAGNSEAAAEEDLGREGVEIVGHVLKPVPLDWSEKRMAGLALPDGFALNVFASGLENVRMIDIASDGTLYVTRRTNGDVLMLRDTDGDGTADMRKVVVSREQLHGIQLDGDTVYLTTVNELLRAPILADGSFGPIEIIIDDMPEGGQHPNRMVVKGPGEKLYVSIGSTCNACGETNDENATIVAIDTDGSGREIFATGLRNTIGYGFEPGTGALYGFDHGIDWLGDNEQHEELNRIEAGKQYGWPYVYALSRFNPQDVPPGGVSFSEYAAASVEPIGLHTPHSAPMQMAFYTGGVPGRCLYRPARFLEPLASVGI